MSTLANNNASCVPGMVGINATANYERQESPGWTDEQRADILARDDANRAERAEELAAMERISISPDDACAIRVAAGFLDGALNLSSTECKTLASDLFAIAGSPIPQ